MQKAGAVRLPVVDQNCRQVVPQDDQEPVAPPDNLARKGGWPRLTGGYFFLVPGKSLVRAAGGG
jgi:hypothetical protein